MKVSKPILLFVILLGTITSIFGQNCRNFHKKNVKVPRNEDYRYYGQSKSAVMVANKTTVYRAVFYGNKDYKVIFCSEFGDYPVRYVIKSIEDNKVLYDNIIDDYVESVGFTIDNTQCLLFEITLISDETEKQEREDIEQRFCVGMQILWRKIGTIGLVAQN